MLLNDPGNFSTQQMVINQDEHVTFINPFYFKKIVQVKKLKMNLRICYTENYYRNYFTEITLTQVGVYKIYQYVLESEGKSIK